MPDIIREKDHYEVNILGDDGYPLLFLAKELELVELAPAKAKTKPTSNLQKISELHKNYEQQIKELREAYIRGLMIDTKLTRAYIERNFK